jgi:hypothetical protein
MATLWCSSQQQSLVVDMYVRVAAYRWRCHLYSILLQHSIELLFPSCMHAFPKALSILLCVSFLVLDYRHRYTPVAVTLRR